MNLSQMVREYEREAQPRLDELLEFYRKMPSLREAVEAAALARYTNGGKHPHQYRLPNDVLRKAADLLLRHLDAIEECESFDDLIRLVESTAGGLDGFGVVAIYDTALRIGGYLEIYPDKIHLHAGVRKGCKALKSALGLTTVDCTGRTVQPSALPSSLQRLQAHQIENFLCIFKDRLANARFERDEVRGGCLPRRPRARC